MSYAPMSSRCSIHVHVFLVTLCFVSTTVVFESLLGRELSSQESHPKVHHDLFQSVMDPSKRTAIRACF